MISSVETLSSNGCRTSASGDAVTVRSSWAAIRPGSSVRTRTGPRSRTGSASRDNDPPYLVVGQRPAGPLRLAQHVLHQAAVGGGAVDAVDGEPVPDVAR